MTNPTTAIATTNSFYNVAKKLETKEIKEKEGKKTMATGTKTGADVYTYPSYGKYNTGKYTTYTPKYTYTGNLNKTDFPEFVNICKMSQKKLKQFLCGKMKDIYPETTYIGNGYIFCKGEIPVLLTAHMDTVHNKLIEDFFEDVQTDKNGKVTHKLSSPQGIGGDDRCGVYGILEIVKRGYRPSILFCEDEEIGGIGSEKFCKTEYIKDLTNMKFLIELDRANANDLVFYKNDNLDWINWVEDETNWEVSWGSFSDICHLSPACGIASVNLSCGYYNAHTVGEYVIMEELLETIKIVEHLLLRSETVEPFEYIEKKYSLKSYGYKIDDYWDSLGYRGNYSRNYYDYDDYDAYYDEMLSKKYNLDKEDKEESVQMEIIYNDYVDGQDKSFIVEGNSESDCWCDFFMKHGDICYNDVLDYYVY